MPMLHLCQRLSKEEMLREKFSYLRKLEQLEKKGVELTKKYSMESSLSEMMGEYEMIMNEKEKQNSVKFQGNMLSALINGIEFLNNKFDPFDVHLMVGGNNLMKMLTIMMKFSANFTKNTNPKPRWHRNLN